MKPQAGGGATWFVQHRLKCQKANSGEFQNQEFQIQRQKTKIAVLVVHDNTWEWLESMTSLSPEEDFVFTSFNAVLKRSSHVFSYFLSMLLSIIEYPLLNSPVS